MKRILLLLLFAFCFLPISIFAQQRYITRGAVPGEFYFSNVWYANYGNWGPPYYDSIFLAIYHLTENGKKLTIQYNADLFSDFYTEPGSVMHPEYILADATSGILYNSDMDPFVNDRLWFSDDYGKTWEVRDIPNVQCVYYAANVEGMIYKGQEGAEILKSMDYGATFLTVDGTCWKRSEFGWEKEEVFVMGALSGGYDWNLNHTHDLFQTYIEIPIAPEYVYGGLSGYFPDVFRGGLSGEVYVTSLFPGNPGYMYKVSFSADTGYNFRVVYQQNEMADFMSDRKAGDFYIVNPQFIETAQPWGWYNRICIKYFTDYGEILEAVFCHDLVRDYEYVENPCEHTTDLFLEVMNENSIQLQWSNVADNIRGYHVFRNGTRITSEMLTGTTYLDENLPDGTYEYFVRAYYEEGCPSDSSNHVMGTIIIDGIETITNDGLRITVYPNPANDELRITNYELRIENVEIFDLMGRVVYTVETRLLRQAQQPLASLQKSPLGLDISHLPSGMYFIRITTDKGMITKKLVKR